MARTKRSRFEILKKETFRRNSPALKIYFVQVLHLFHRFTRVSSLTFPFPFSLSDTIKYSTRLGAAISSGTWLSFRNEPYDYAAVSSNLCDFLPRNTGYPGQRKRERERLPILMTNTAVTLQSRCKSGNLRSRGRFRSRSNRSRALERNREEAIAIKTLP